MSQSSLESGPYPLHWVDDYISKIKDFVYLRQEDNLLIKVPNEAFKLNQSGISILKAMFKGVSVRRLLDELGDTDERRRDIYYFFIALKKTLLGCQDGKAIPGFKEVPFKLPFNTKPVLSEIALTYKCNVRCRFCYTGCTQDKEKYEMSTRDVEDVIKKIRYEAEVPSVSFTGGEPTLRDDLVHLVSYAKKLGMRVNLITNATRITAKLAKSLAQAGLASAQVSLEGASPEVHDGLTQIKGSFQKTLSGMEELKRRGIRVHPNSTINRVNQEDLMNMPAFVHSHGWQRFSMNLIIPAGAAKNDASILIPYSQIGDYLVNMSEKARTQDVKFMWYSPTPMCIFNPIAYGLGNKGCSACDGLLSVSPNGDILPCSSYPEPVGNLLTKGFKEIWDSERAIFFRHKKFAPPKCQQCEEFAVCNSACPLYWNHFGYSELDCIAKSIAAGFTSAPDMQI